MSAQETSIELLHEFTRQKAEMLKALAENLGIVTHAAAQVGIERKTHYNWYKSDEHYRSAVNELDNVVIDYCEHALMRLINEGNPAAIIFALKTKGKHRGWMEKVQIEHSVKRIEVTK